MENKELVAKAKRLNTVLEALQDVDEGLEVAAGQLLLLGQPDAASTEREMREDLVFLQSLADAECHTLVGQLARTTNEFADALESDETKELYSRRSLRTMRDV